LNVEHRTSNVERKEERRKLNLESSFRLTATPSAVKMWTANARIWVAWGKALSMVGRLSAYHTIVAHNKGSAFPGRSAAR